MTISSDPAGAPTSLIASRARRRGSAWVQLGQGIQRQAGLDERTALLAELRAWSPVLPASGVFSGLTSARVHDLWLPPLPDRLPVFVAMGTIAGEVKPWRPQLWVTRHPTSPKVAEVDGLRVSPVDDTLLACARVLGLIDLVVVVDSALHLGLTTRAEIATVAAQLRRGAPRLRLALSLSDGRAESRWEGLLRLFHHAIGVSVTPQVDLHGPDGLFLGRADLLLDGTRTLHEYDGVDHRDKDQHRKDLRRDRALVSGDYVRRGYTSKELISPPMIILRDCDATLGRRHDPRRIDPWFALLRDSLYSRWGTSALEQMLAARSARWDGRKLVPLVTDTGD